MMNFTTRHPARVLLIATGVAVLAMVAIAAAMWPVRAAAADKGATTLTMAAPKTGMAGTLILSATLKGPDGKPVANAPIDFTFQVDVLGQTAALLGTVPTTVSGTATWIYRLQQNGPVDFVAQFGGNSTLAASTSKALRYAVTGAPVTEPSQASRVNLVGQWVPWAALVLVLSVWLTLIGVAVRTVVAIPSAARGFEPTATGELATRAWQAVSDLEAD